MAATGTRSALGEARVGVPDDVWLLAVHDTWFTHLTVPSLTTVRMPLFEPGSGAIEVLLEMVGGGEARHQVVEESRSTLIQRDSARPGTG